MRAGASKQWHTPSVNFQMATRLGLTLAVLPVTPGVLQSIQELIDAEGFVEHEPKAVLAAFDDGMGGIITE